MARYSLAYGQKTMVGVADGAAMTDNGYAVVLLGGSTTMQVRVNEVYIGGESTSSTPTSMALGRDSTIAATGLGNVNIFNVLQDASATAPGTLATAAGSSTTKPIRSATLGHLLNLSLNTFGGIARWQARYGEEITAIGNTASLGELSLSSVTGNGIISGHMLYELV